MFNNLDGVDLSLPEDNQPKRDYSAEMDKLTQEALASVQSYPDVQPLSVPQPSVPQYVPQVGGKGKDGKERIYLPPAQYMPLFEEASKKYGVSISALMALAFKESRYNPKAKNKEPVNGEQAQGIFQFMPSVAASPQYNINPNDPVQAIDAAAKMFKWFKDRGYSDVEAMQGHFAGPKGKQWGPKTQQYGVDAERVQAEMKNLYGQYLKSKGIVSGGGQQQSQPKAAVPIAQQGQAQSAPVKEESWYDTPVAIAKGLGMSLVTGSGQALGGALQAFGDVVGTVTKPLAEARILPQDVGGLIAKGGADLYKKHKDLEQQYDPKIQNPTGDAAYQGFRSVIQQLPGIATSVATGNPAPALSLMSVQTGLPKYSEAREAGVSGIGATNFALAQGLTEYATEKIPMGHLFKSLGKEGFTKLLIGQIAREVPGEQIATLVQDALDHAVLTPNKPWGEYIAERPMAAYKTLVATAAGTGLQTGAAHGASKLISKAQMAAESKRNKGIQSQAQAQIENRKAATPEEAAAAQAASPNQASQATAAPQSSTVSSDGIVSEGGVTSDDELLSMLMAGQTVNPSTQEVETKSPGLGMGIQQTHQNSQKTQELSQYHEIERYLAQALEPYKNKKDAIVPVSSLSSEPQHQTRSKREIPLLVDFSTKQGVQVKIPAPVVQEAISKNIPAVPVFGQDGNPVIQNGLPVTVGLADLVPPSSKNQIAPDWVNPKMGLGLIGQSNGFNEKEAIKPALDPKIENKTIIQPVKQDSTIQPEPSNANPVIQSDGQTFKTKSAATLHARKIAKEQGLDSAPKAIQKDGGWSVEQDTPIDIKNEPSNEGFESKWAEKSSPSWVKLVEHTTKKGKVITGIIRKDLTLKEAKEIDPFTFKKDGGWFIRDKHLNEESNANSSQPESFDDDLSKIDKSATEGYKAGLEGTGSKPSGLNEFDDAAWKIGYRRGTEDRNQKSTVETKTDSLNKQKQEESPSQEEVKQSEKLEDRPADFGKNNKIFTRDAYEKALERMRSKRNQFNAGIDPEMLLDGITIFGFYLETGVRKFADVAKAMAKDTGIPLESLRPHLRGWYNGARDSIEDHGGSIEGMQSAEEVKAEMKALFDEGNESNHQQTNGSQSKNTDLKTVVTPSGKEFQVKHKIVEADDLITSNDSMGGINPDYPQHLQPRDRTRAASQLQINNIASKMNPKLLGENPSTTDGAPIVSNKGVVESGNGRTLAIKRAYDLNMPTANAYRQHLKDLGHNIEGMKKPILVRERQTDMTHQELLDYTQDSNERTTLALSPVERAKADAKGLDMSLYQGGDVAMNKNSEFVRAFIKSAVSQSDRAAMTDGGGSLSQDGKRRLEAAMLQAAYDNPGLISEVFESTDTDIKAIGGALLDASGNWAQMRQYLAEAGLEEIDLTPNMIEAVGIIKKARMEGVPVKDMAAQNDIFSGALDPATEDFLSIFYRGSNLHRARSRDKVADALNFYADLAKEIQPSESMFDDVPVLTGRDILKSTIERTVNNETTESQDLFSSEKPANPDTSPSSQDRQRSVSEGKSHATEKSGTTESKEFDAKIDDFLKYVRESVDGRRLVAKIKSNVSDNEIYDGFSKIYRQYRALNRQTVGDSFFNKTEGLVEKLYDDFKKAVIEDWSVKQDSTTVQGVNDDNNTATGKADIRAGDEGVRAQSDRRNESRGEDAGLSGRTDGEVRGSGRGRIQHSGVRSENSSNSESVGEGSGGKQSHKNDGGRGDRTDSGRNQSDGLKNQNNHRIAPGSIKRTGSWFDTAERNVQIIEMAKQIENEGRLATPEEKQFMSLYTGWGASEIANNLFPDQYGRYKTDRWGGLGQRLKGVLSEKEYAQAARTTQYAHYTSESVIRSIFSAMDRMGFKGGSILEPGMGIGLFNGLMPESMSKQSAYTGIEYDSTTGRIAKLLYPDSNIIVDDYSKVSLPKNFFDAAIGNPPFSSTVVSNDPEYKKHRMMLHDYFFAKTIDRLKPGGVVAFVTSKGTMDKKNDRSRTYLAERADLIGAIRLPQTAFKENAGTEVVTDILFLQKRAEGVPPSGVKWLETSTISTPQGDTQVNQYFAEHPEMVLGNQELTGSMYRKDEYTVTPFENSDIDQLLNAAVKKLPKNIVSEKEVSVAKKVIEHDFDPKNKKEGGVYVADDGTLMSVENGVGTPLTHRIGSNGKPIELKSKDVEFLKDYSSLRDAIKQTHFDQLTDGDWETSLKALQKEYRSFVKKHGNLLAYTTLERQDKNGETVETKRFKNSSLLKIDAEGALVYALEGIKENGEIAKGNVLEGRVLEKRKQPEIHSAKDAMLVVFDKSGALDIGHIAELANMKESEVIEELGDLIYEDPSNGWTSSEEYLSGNVKRKLKEAEQASRLDKRYKRNVDALKKVQPRELTHQDISAKLGMNWIPESVLNDFAKEVLNIKTSVQRDGFLGTYKVNEGYSYHASDFSFNRMSAGDILEKVLNNSQIKLMTPKDSEGNTYLDTAATEKANDLATKMRDAFKKWIWSDQERTNSLLKDYNEKFNNITPRTFDGSHLTLPGVSSRFNLYPHQKRAVWRIIQQGNVYLAHSVGAGKTMEMIAAGMEERRLGLIKKPLYVVPNHMLAQFSKEFLELYPAAHIMVADEENFHTHNRKRFTAQIALNNPDAVIMTHSSFGKINVSDETADRFEQKLIDEFRETLESVDESNKTTRKRIEAKIEKLERRVEDRRNSSKKDNVLTFEELGVDKIYIDEAHEFRKLDFSTNQGNIKGITPDGSAKAFDLYMKTQYLKDQGHKRYLVMASGTPITNTMGELFTVQRFFQADQLEEDGHSNFDDWASQYGDIVSGLEQNAAGGYETVSRFAKFQNVPELMRRVRSFMDILTSSSLSELVTRPNAENGGRQIVVTPQSEEYKGYQKTLQSRIEAIKRRSGPPVKGQDIILSVIADGRFSSIDMRFADPTLPSDPNSKLNRVIDDVASAYFDTKDIEYFNKETSKPDPIKGSSIILFTDLGLGEQSALSRGFNMKDWIVKRLTEAGIPKGHIAFMRDYKQHSKKERLFADMREGKKRILIGGKDMETGVNVQKRLTHLFHLDAPWFPASVEQREGRIIRQGNQNKTVSIKAYATKGSYDSTMWSMNARKAKFIEQALNGDDSVRSMDDVSESSAFEMASALASGDERYLKLAGLRGEVEKLERLRSSHVSEQRTLATNKLTAERSLENTRKQIELLKPAVQNHKPIGAGEFAATIDGVNIDSRDEFGKSFSELFRNLTNSGVTTEPDGKIIGNIGGFNLVYEAKKSRVTGDLDASAYLKLPHKEEILAVYPLDLRDYSFSGSATRAVNQINSIPKELASLKENADILSRRIEAIKGKIGAVFSEEGIYAEKQEELYDLEGELEAESKAQAEMQKEAEVAVINQDGEVVTPEKVDQPDESASNLDKIENDKALEEVKAELDKELGTNNSDPKIYFSKSDVRAALHEGAEPFRSIEPTHKQWEEDFPDGFVNTPIGKVKIGENQLEKLIANNRGRFAGLVKPTLENPTFVVENDRGAKVFVKAFLNETGGLRGFISVTYYIDDLNVVVSNYRKDINALVKEVNAGKLVHPAKQVGYLEIEATAPSEFQSPLSGGIDSSVLSEQNNGNTLSADEIRSSLSSEIEGLNKAGNVIVQIADSINQLPPFIKSAYGETVEAFYIKGRVVLIADAIRSIDRAREILAHETVGHAGMEQMLGEGLMNSLVRRVQMIEKAGNKQFKSAAQWVDESQPGLDKNIRAREIIAVLAERGVHHEQGIMSKIVTAIRGFLKRMGFNAKWVQEIRADDIYKLLRQAEKFIKTPRNEEGEAIHSNEAKFSKSKGLFDEENKSSKQKEANTEKDPEQQKLDMELGKKELPQYEQGSFKERLRRYREKIQDRYVRVQEVQDAIVNQGGRVNDQSNIYQAETLRHGRMQAQGDFFFQEEVQPLLNDIGKAGFTPDDVALTAYAQHAPERNAQIATIRDDMQDGGSGMTNADAAHILQEFQNVFGEEKFNQLKDFAQRLRDITQKTAKHLHQEGLIDGDTLKAWNDSYQSYVPLKGFENTDENGESVSPSMNVGKIGNVRGAEAIRALGRKSRAGQIFEHVVQDRLKAIYRAENNRVGKVLLQFVLNNPDKSLWTTDYVKDGGAVSTQKPVLKDGKVVIANVLDVKNDPSIYTVKVKGKEVHVKIKDKAMAEAMSGIHDEKELNEVMTFFFQANRVLTLMFTGLNPTFTAVNFVRDFTSGSMQNLKEFGVKGMAKGMAYAPLALNACRKENFGSIKTAIQRDEKGLPKEWSDWYREMRAAGGLTGFMDLRSIQSIQKQIALEVNAAAGDKKAIAKKTVENIFKFVENANAAIEASNRLAAYRVAREEGRTPQQAAEIAKDATVNFNRRGRQRMASAWFLFFNPAIQGTERIISALGNKRVQAAASIMVASSLALALANAGAGGDDEDGTPIWDKIHPSEKARNLIIMNPLSKISVDKDGNITGGVYLKIPLAYGWNVFNVLGAAAADYLRNKQDPARGMDGEKASKWVLSETANAFNPLGGDRFIGGGISGTLGALTPAVLKPFSEIAMNEDGLGRKLHPEPMPGQKLARSEQYFPNMRNTIWQKTSSFLNRATGGNSVEDGLISIRPGDMKHVVTFFGGGPLRFATDLVDSFMSGDPMKAPFVRQFAGQDSTRNSLRRAQEAYDLVDAKDKAYKSMEKSGLDADMKGIEKEFGHLLELGASAETYKREMISIRKERNALEEDTSISKDKKEAEIKKLEALQREAAHAFRKEFDAGIRKADK